MRFALSDEQEHLKASLRKFLTTRSPLERVREIIDGPTPYDRDVWTEMATQLGLHGIAIPEHYGGSGYTFVEQAVVLEELGRSLVPTPYLSSVVLAATCLLAADDHDACARWLPAIASGEVVATLAVLERDASWELTSITTTAESSGDRHELSGEKSFVTDGLAADVLLVVASGGAGPDLYVVEASAPGLEREAVESFDRTRPLATIRMARTPARRLGAAGSGLTVLRAAMARAAVGVACEQAGAAARCLDMAVDYAKTRVQFSRPIGSFQSIKHMLADVLLDVESANAAAYYAAWVADHDPGNLGRAASLCKSEASDTLWHAAGVNLQVHGAIGFTWEHNAHLFLRRAVADRQLLGSPRLHRERLAALILS